MKHKFAALFMTLVVVLSSTNMVFASSDITVHVNTAVRLGDNVVVDSNAISESDLMKKYEESKEQVTSSTSDVDSNADRILEDLVPPTITVDDLKGSKTKKSLTYEEFMGLLGEMGELPDSSPIIDEYEKALKRKQDKQRKANQLTAKEIKDFYEKIRKGLNPFTGEPFDESDNFVDDNEEGRKAAWENAHPVDTPRGGTSSGSSNGNGSSTDDQFQQNSDEMSDFIKEQYEDMIKNGEYNLVQHEKLDKSEYEDDELVYKKKNNNITDIHYRCSKCGELYGFDKFCACDRPKYLDGEVYQYVCDNKSILSWGWNFKGFNDKGVAKNRAFWSSPLTCGLCHKKLTLDSISFKKSDDDKFYIGSNGTFKCHECQNKYGGGAEKLNYYEGHPEDLLPEGWPEWADPNKIDDLFQRFSVYIQNIYADDLNTLEAPYIGMLQTFLGAERKIAEDNGNTDDMEFLDSMIEYVKIADPEKLDAASAEVVERDWTKYDPHFDEFISPCTPLLPDGNSLATDDDMFNYFLATVPEEKREEFTKLRDTYKNGSDKEMEEEFLDTIELDNSYEFAWNLMYLHANGSEEDVFDYFMSDASNIPEEMRGKFIDLKGKFEKGDPGAFDEFLDTIKSENTWSLAWNLMHLYETQGWDAAVEFFMSRVPDDMREKFEEAAGNSEPVTQTQPDSRPNSERRAENNKKIKKYIDKYCPDNDKPIDEWTEEDFQKMYEKMVEDYNKSVPPLNDMEGEKIKDTEQFEDDANKIFGDWTADQSTWTEGQWAMYDEFRDKYGNDETYKDMIDEGVFGADMSPEEISKAIDNYIAGFTSVKDNVTLVTVVDYTDIRDVGQGGSYDVKGNTRASVTDESGKVVAERESVGGMPMTWVAYEAGRYTVTRYVDVYHIEWNFQECTARVNAEIILPDGTSAGLISGYETTRIIENKDGFKQTNCRTLAADSFVVNVIEDSSDINKAEFYDTERVK